jgi:MFS family permease
MALVMLIATPLTPRVRTRFGPRAPLRAGAVCAIVSFAALAFAHDHLWQVYVANVIVGAGYGMAFSALGALVVDAVEPGHTGVATGVNTIARTAGGAIGAQIAAAIVPRYTLAFVVFALVAVAALAVTSAIPGRVRAPSRRPPLKSTR